MMMSRGASRGGQGGEIPFDRFEISVRLPERTEKGEESVWHTGKVRGASESSRQKAMMAPG